MEPAGVADNSNLVEPDGDMNFVVAVVAVVEVALDTIQHFDCSHWWPPGLGANILVYYRS